MENINITLIQSQIIWEDVDKNLDNFANKINSIKEATDLIVLPEMFNTGFTMNPEKYAEDKMSQTIDWLKQKAKQKNSVVTGSIAIKENSLFYNRLIWMKPDGSFEQYDKRHLFRLSSEPQLYTRGQKQLVTELKGWKFKPMICYDLRFPVWSKNSMSADNKFEYDCLIYSANWPSIRKYTWKSLLIARAIENISYAIGVNCIGKDVKGVSYSGESIAADYSGKIISELKSDVEEVQTIKLSYNDLDRYRQHYAFGLDWDKFNIH